MRIQERLSSIPAELRRNRYAIEHRAGNRVRINKRDQISFTSSDYLGLSQHPEVIESFSEGAKRYGLGSTASAIVAGYYTAQRDLEERFAALVNRDRALFFNSGYHANLGVITAIADRNSLVVADKLCHASILDAVQLSRAKLQRYPHLNFQRAQTLLSTASACSDKLLMSESVFSMEGDIAPIAELAKIAEASSALLMVDDAHGFGILGEDGLGICEYLHLDQTKVPVLITPFGKALGSQGAMVAGSDDLIELLLQTSRSYRYTTALPPAIAMATLTALEILVREKERRTQLQKIIAYFIEATKQRRLILVSTDLTPIKSIMVGDNQIVVKVQEQLLDDGFFVSCIRPPTVPKNTARIRISLNCMHTTDEIDHLLDALVCALKGLSHE